MARSARPQARARFERKDMTGTFALWSAIAFVLSVIALAGIVTAIGYGPLDVGPPQEAANRTVPPANARPGPRLQADPTAELRAYRARVAQRLHSYGWVDRAQGIVHVPIGRAMEIEAARQKGQSDKAEDYRR